MSVKKGHHQKLKTHRDSMMITPKQIYYILFKKISITKAKTYSREDASTDYQLLAAGLRVRIRKKKPKRKVQTCFRYRAAQNGNSED